MAIQKCARILATAIADGESTQFVLDLATDPYWVGETTSTGTGGDITNWEPTRATDVLMVSGATGANMAGAGSTVVIVDVAAAGPGTIYKVVLDIVFGG